VGTGFSLSLSLPLSLFLSLSLPHLCHLLRSWSCHFREVERHEQVSILWSLHLWLIFALTPNCSIHPQNRKALAAYKETTKASRDTNAANGIHWRLEKQELLSGLPFLKTTHHFEKGNFV